MNDTPTRPEGLEEALREAANDHRIWAGLEREPSIVADHQRDADLLTAAAATLRRQEEALRPFADAASWLLEQRRSGFMPNSTVHLAALNAAAEIEWRHFERARTLTSEAPDAD